MRPFEIAQKITGWTDRNIKDGTRVSALMFYVLYEMAKAFDNYLWVSLDDISNRTIRSLLERDFIVKSKGLDGSIKYKITRRGHQALNELDRPPKWHRDGLCPMCRNNKKAIGGYCFECIKVKNRNNYLKYGKRPTKDSS